LSRLIYLFTTVVEKIEKGKNRPYMKIHGFVDRGSEKNRKLFVKKTFFDIMTLATEQKGGLYGRKKKAQTPADE
jgi:cephalosporin-C deacetylase-like acetyl esterase